jgi:hypothetical protein
MSASRKRKQIVKPANAKYRFACTRSMCIVLPLVTCTVSGSGSALKKVAGRGIVPAPYASGQLTNFGRGSHGNWKRRASRILEVDRGVSETGR